MNFISKNTDIVGHEKIEKELARSIVSGKIFPTWIFNGPFGIGKFSIALKFAKCLLSGIIPSEKFLSLDISPDNPIHHLVDSRIHPDFFVLEQSEESVSINDTRELLEKIYKTPTMSQWRVVILENATNLNKNIYNSLLKVLEEPPKNTVIILISQNIGNFPKTLLSRASKVYFNSISEANVRSVLQKLKMQNANELAKISNGSVGYAIYLNEYGGLEIFNNLLRAFSLADKKAIQSVIEDNLSGTNSNSKANIRIVKESLLKIFHMYIEEVAKVQQTYSSENQFSKTDKARKFPEEEIKKILEIISMLNKMDALMLDKQAVLAYTFEKFFEF